MNESPLARFAAWYEEAVAAGVPMPDAVCLATATPDGRPSARLVLYKGMHEDGLAFYTNYGSRKARQIEANPWAALVFHWVALNRQVRFEGRVERLPEEVSDAYFASRDRGSRLSAWASRQSQPVADRDAMERRFAEIEARFAESDVPRPEFWGGYRLVPERAELWHGRANRFHDRIEYLLGAAGWERRRLQP